MMICSVDEGTAASWTARLMSAEDVVLDDDDDAAGAGAKLEGLYAAAGAAPRAWA